MTVKQRLFDCAANLLDTAAKSSDDFENVVILNTDFIKDVTSFSDNSFQEIKSLGFLPDEDAMAVIYRLLAPNAKFLIEGIPDRETGQVLAVDLKIQGFLDIMAAKDPITGERFIVCQKPNWEVGASASVNIVVAPANKWKMDTSDLGESDLIDEDTLIDKNFEVPAPNAACGEDNGGGKKRACANCSCGLAEQEAAAGIATLSKATLEEKISKASSCGGCAKGDAFRCAGCPFLGKPAFEPGTERVVLALDADDF